MPENGTKISNLDSAGSLINITHHLDIQLNNDNINWQTLDLIIITSELSLIDTMPYGFMLSSKQTMLYLEKQNEKDLSINIYRAIAEEIQFLRDMRRYPLDLARLQLTIERTGKRPTEAY